MKNSLRFYLIVLLALIPFIAMAILHWFDGLGLYAGDYAQYLLHGRALFEGNNYADIGFILNQDNNLIGPEAEPPGLPLLIYSLFFLFGEIMTPIKIAVFLLTIAFFIFSTKYFYLLDDKKLSILMLLILSLLPMMVINSSHIQTDLPFCALVWATIYFADCRFKWTWFSTVLIALLGSIAILIRTAGVALIPGMVLFLLIQYKNTGIKPIFPILIWISCYLVMSALVPVNGEMLDEMIFHPMKLLSDIVSNLYDYRFAIASSHGYPFVADKANDYYHLMTVVIMVIGALSWLRKGYCRFLTHFSICYIALLLLLPFAQSRYFWPLYPMFIFMLFYGAYTILYLLTRSKNLSYLITIMAGVCLALVLTYQSITKPYKQSLVDHPDVISLFSYVKQNIPIDSSKISFFKPRILTWHTRIPAMGLAESPPAKIFKQLIEKDINYIIVGDLGVYPKITTDLRTTVKEYPDHFKQVYSNSSFTLYAVIRH